jgi:hypothetical protein
MTRYWAEAVVVVIVLLLWAPRLSGPIDLRWDAGVYYVLGKSLAMGHGYKILSEPGSPEALQYPPLLPTVVALYQRALGSMDPAVVAPWLRVSYATLFLAYALALLALGKRYLQTGFAVTAVVLSLLQVNAIFLSDLLFTELPFALVSVVFVLVAADSRVAAPRQWIRETVSFVLAAIGFFLRTAGIALLVAWVIEALGRRHWRLALMRGVLAALPIIAWEIHVTQVRGSYEYTHPAYAYQRAAYQPYNVSYAQNVGLIDSTQRALRMVSARVLAVRFTTNIGSIIKGLGETISTPEYYWRHFLADGGRRWLGRQVIPVGFVLVPIICLSALAIAGIAMLARRRAWLIVFVVLISVVLICTTPWPDQFQRYLMPLTAFLAIAALLALSQLRVALQASRRLHPAIVSVGGMASVGLIALALTVQTCTACQLFYQRWSNGVNSAGAHYFYYGPRWRAWEGAVAWIAANTPPDAIVATPECYLCYLRTNRRAIFPPMEADPTRARQLLQAVPVSYVMIAKTESSSRRYTIPAVEGDAVGWPLVYSADGVQIYERATSRK